MKKNIPIYPFLIALYPIVTLYSRNPGEILPRELSRPMIVSIMATVLLFLLFRLLTGNHKHAFFLSAITIFYTSSSQLAYRIIEGNLWKQAPPSLHVGIIILELLLVSLLVSRTIWRKYMASRIDTLTQYFNIFAVVALLYPLVSLAGFWVRAENDAPRPWSTYIGTQNTSQTLRAPSNTPDIYYIILDGYASENILQEYYNYVNSDFTNYLRSREFYIADQSHSNYVQTALSLSSSLNFDYLDFATELTDKNTINRTPLFELIRNNRTRQILTGLEYRFVVLDSGYTFTEINDADVFISPFRGQPTEFERWFYSTTALNALFEPGFWLSPQLQNLIPLASYATQRGFVLGGLKNLSEVPRIPGPKFVFAHIVAPHPPFVITADGSPITPERPYLTGDGIGFTDSVDEYRRGYIAQVEFINAQVKTIIDNILAQSPDAIIIIQGDHGPGSLLDRDSLENSCMHERTSILNAYRFPGQKSVLYPEVSPVNTFRALFNTYFEADYDLLPDKTYFSPQIHPYEFVDITSNRDAPCLP
jgi:hypothetical protein